MNADENMRCHDDSCHERAECLRWIFKDDGRGAPYNATLRPAWAVPDMKCPEKMDTTLLRQKLGAPDV